MFRAAVNLRLRRTVMVVVSLIGLLPIGVSQGVKELRLSLDGVEILATVMATRGAPSGGWVSGSDWQVRRLLADPVWREGRVSGIAEVPRLIDPFGGRSHWDYET